ncbi:LysE/ArgO family amino acid transporter [Niveispirillum sp.]|uniref:LysE/ArgO family amino acid transporter n=1 Tax=Niveispirillum sp. TaxID=1917217 RepID=UPI001B634694|nr:LysE/ArgO family amino acid transporter [Niveispirillum sp.]MBP7336396.1 amino acid transporter [Niveispirillum sp.]
MSALLAHVLPGYLLGLSLIVAIGAQNAFVLRQGLRGDHVWAVTLTCAFSDALLILAGVEGLARVQAALPAIVPVMRYAGAAFLLAYAVRALRSALRPGATLSPAAAGGPGLAATLATCLALTWLNPHVYLDTVLLIGSVAAGHGEGRHLFAAGAIAASFSFFLALGHGARLLRPLFARPGIWQALDAVIAVTMAALGLGLLIQGA